MLFTPIESWRVFEIVHFLIFLKQVFSGISQCAKNRRKIIVYGVKSAENWLHNKIFISYRKLVPTCVRLDCLPGSLTTWLESWDANADLERVTDLASFANLLRPPRNRSERKFKVLIYYIYVLFILNINVFMYFIFYISTCWDRRGTGLKGRVWKPGVNVSI
jgi:hypothetical protein